MSYLVPDAPDAGPQEQPSWSPFSRRGFVSGLAGGFASDPLVALAMQALPGIDRSDVRRWQRYGTEGLPGKIGHLVGEYGTMLAPSGLVARGGQRVARAALEAAGRGVGTVGVTRLGTRAAMGVGPLARMQERLGQEGLRSSLRGLPALARTGEKLTPDLALAEGLVSPTQHAQLLQFGFKGARPIVYKGAGIGSTGPLERGAEVIGSSTAFGMYEGLRSTARSIFQDDDFDDVPKNAALALLLGVGFEGGLTAIGRIKNIPLDLGTLRLIPMEYRRAIGAKLGNPDLLVNPAGRSTVSVLMRNKLNFAKEELDQPTYRAREYLAQKSSLQKGWRTRKGEISNAVTNTLAQFNRLLGTTIFQSPTGAGFVATPSNIRGIRDVQQLYAATNFSFVGAPRVVARAERATNKYLANLTNFEREAQVMDNMIAGNPLLGYLHGTPYVTTKGAAASTNLALKLAAAPEEVGKHLGPTMGRVTEMFRNKVEIPTLQAVDYSQSLAKKLQIRGLAALGHSGFLGRRALGRDSALLLDATDIIEKFGTDRNAAITQLTSNIRHKTGRLINQAEAGELFDTYAVMQQVMRQGHSSTTRVGQAGALQQRLALRGFDDLTQNNGDLQALSPQNLTRMVGTPTATYMPHLNHNISDEQFWAHVATLPNAVQKNILMRRGSKFRRMPFYSHLDAHRALQGTTKDKILMGIPLDPNPYRAFNKYMVQVQRRYHQGRLAGFNNVDQNRFKAQVIHMVGAENRYNPGRVGIPGNPTATTGTVDSLHSTEVARNLVDIFLERKYEDEANRALASFAIGFQNFTKLSFAALGNLTQIGQTAAYNGFRNTAKAIRTNLSKEQRDHVLYAVANTEGIRDDIVRMFDEDTFQEGNVLARVMSNFFRSASTVSMSASGFKGVEKIQRNVGAASTLHRGIEMITRASGMGSRRTLVGKQLEYARRQARQLGFDLDDVAEQAARSGVVAGPNNTHVFNWFSTPSGLDWAMNTMFAGAQQTQFIQSPMRRPFGWDSPYGRILAQFKTYAVNNYKFLHHNIMGELAQGNHRPATMYLGFAPLAGEFVGNAKAFLMDKQRQDSGPSRFVNNLMFVGAMGVAGDLMKAGQYEQLLESLMGPTVSDIVGLLEQMTRMNFFGVMRDAERQPIVKAAKGLSRAITEVGGPTVEWLEDLLESTGDGQAGPVGTIYSSGVLRVREQ